MNPEPWLRGPLADVNPLLAPVLRALEQAQEDLQRHCSLVDDEEIWTALSGLAPLGFHLRHIAGSLDRLTTYLEGRELNEDQLAFLKREMDGDGSREELLALITNAIGRAAEVVRSLDIYLLAEARSVGRQHLPTTAIGLAVHLAEHTQRHVGQAIVYCNLLQAIR